MDQEFVTFELERFMSLWENRVEYNLSESGVSPLTVNELVEDEDVIEELLSASLGYPQSNGLAELRERVAALYPGATSGNVLITTGCAQANFTAFLTTLDPGDEVAYMLPNYLQILGLARNFGCGVKAFSLSEDLDWALDRDELDRAVTPETKLIATVNPNNPTGHIMTTEEMRAVVRAAERVGAWLLCDEVYAGTERLTDEVSPSFWGRYDRTLVTGSLSKAYGLPGLRIGWIVAPSDVVDRAWAWQDYVTISTTMLANKLAAYTLSPGVRKRVLKRTRDCIRSGYQHLERWIDKQADLLTVVPPQAAAIAFVRYDRDIGATELVRRLIDEQVFVAPGDMFGMDHFLRISFGLPADYLEAGLNRVGKVLHSVT